MSCCCFSNEDADNDDGRTDDDGSGDVINLEFENIQETRTVN